MLKIGRHFYACDECPICEGVEHRLQAAQEGGYEPQFEYCGCDKVQTEFLFSGHCEDGYLQLPRIKKKGKRKTGMAYRRDMRVKHRDAVMKILSRGYYKPTVGYVDWDYEDGQFKQVGKYIKYPKNSNAERYWKRHSNRVIRRRNELYQRNQYRKCFDYWWTLY